MKFKDYLNEAPIGAKGWTEDSVVKFGKTIGIAPGEHGFFDACVLRMKDEMGDQAEGFCASLKDMFYGSAYWRGKGKLKKDIKKDVKEKPFKKGEKN